VPIEIVPPLPYFNPVTTVVCYEDQPVDWHGMVISSSCVTPPCTARLEGPDGCLIDSIRMFDLLPMRPEGLKDTFLCGGGVILTEDGRTFTTDACEEEISFKDPRFFCDTTYILNARFFKYSHMWDAECGDCFEPGVKLCPNVEYDPDCSLFDDGSVTIQLEWVRLPGGGVINTTDGTGCMTFTQPGAYCVDVIPSYLGKKCPVSGRECFTIDDSWFPEAQPITGDSSVCGTVPGEYRVDSILAVCEYIWEIRAGGGVIITPFPSDTHGILVDWGNRTGPNGLVCAKVLTTCGESPDTCFFVDFAGAPVISAGPDTNICAQAYTMTGFEDIGGMWTQTAGPAQANIINPNLITTDVNVGTYGEYKFIWSESENGCESVDTVTIGFRPDPTIENIDTICGGDATDFTVTFDLMTGTAPFTIVSGGGTIMGSTYTSDVIPDNTPTTIVIRDFYGCETTFFIDHDCVCPNATGEIDQTPLEFCGVQEACAIYDDSGEILDAGDISVYVLYTTLGQIDVSQIATNATGCFTYDPGTMTWGQTYYIGVVVGQDNGMGGVDFAAGCVQVEEATPVTWYENPTPDAGADDEVCGAVFDLNGVSSINGSTYEWINVPGVTFGDASQLNTTATIQITGFGTYELILEETNAICVSRDTIEVTFFEEPEPINTEKICLDFNTYEYKICFDIQKGTGPYTIIQGGGTIDPGTGQYCSDSLMSLEQYDIIIRDANGCEFRLTGTHNCDCGPTNPGTMPQDVIETCVGLCADIVTNGTEMPQADEEAEFILHEGSGTVIINEITRMSYDHAANPAEVVQFCFDAGVGMVPGRVYYISRVVHEIGNLADECERISAGQPIIWNNYPSADPGIDEDVCGLSTTLNASPSIGVGGWTLTNSPAGSNAIFTNVMPASMLTVDQYGSYTFQWKEDNAGCADSASITINFHDAPVVSNIMFECDNVAENYRVIFTINGGESSSLTVNGNAASSPFTSGWMPSGSPSNFTITDSWDCAPTQIDTIWIIFYIWTKFNSWLKTIAAFRIPHVRILKESCIQDVRRITKESWIFKRNFFFTSIRGKGPTIFS